MINPFALFGSLVLVGLAASGGEAAPATPHKDPSSGAMKPAGTGAITWHDGRGPKLTDAQRKENYIAVRRMGKALEAAGLFGPGFAEWLMVVSRTEARGNPAAGSDAFSNAARGMYGFRPTTAWNEAATKNGVPREWDEDDAELAFANGEVTGEEVRALKDLVWSTALAAHNVNRLRKYTKGGPYTRLGARRGWAFPSLVPDLDNSERPELLERWNEALAYFGLPADFGEGPMKVLVNREDFPHPATIRQILLDAIEGKETDPHNQPGFIPGTIEWGDHSPGSGFTYGWALGHRVEGGWSWAIDRYFGDNPEPVNADNGETQSRNEAAQAIIDRVEAWEASA